MWYDVKQSFRDYPCNYHFDYTCTFLTSAFESMLALVINYLEYQKKCRYWFIKNTHALTPNYLEKSSALSQM